MATMKLWIQTFRTTPPTKTTTTSLTQQPTEEQSVDGNPRADGALNKYATVGLGVRVFASSPCRGEKGVKTSRGGMRVGESLTVRRAHRALRHFLRLAALKQTEDRLRQGLGVRRVSINNATFNLASGIGFVPRLPRPVVPRQRRFKVAMQMIEQRTRGLPSVESAFFRVNLDALVAFTLGFCSRLVESVFVWIERVYE
ncbi:hypothetical protein K0M31_018881 [Melipona bicolor]|uniref:Uncharacterized protein n=1 Tax=Melipona bicolor TaxID=60889 RepID=A0AA40G4F7_9HYME|nr:hypothetical protein K0M31_018881 [Melipona bicolor]